MDNTTSDSNRHAVACDVCKELIVFSSREQVRTFLHDPVCSDECAERDDAEKWLPSVSFPGSCKVCNAQIAFPTSAALRQFKAHSICSTECAFLDHEGLPYVAPDPNQPRRRHETVNHVRRNPHRHPLLSTKITDFVATCISCEKLIFFNSKQELHRFKEVPLCSSECYFWDQEWKQNTPHISLEYVPHFPPTNNTC
jgi:hypothetical protein